MNPATGSALVFGLGTEPARGVPGSQLIAYDPGLPSEGGFTPSIGESIQVNSSGFLRPGVPGAKNGAFNWRHPLTAGHLLEIYMGIFGHCTKDEPEDGIFRYVFRPRLAVGRTDLSSWGIVAKEPVERRQVRGVTWQSLELPIADNAEIPANMVGVPLNETLLGPVDPDAGNTGTYVLGPHVRGLLRWPELGDVHVEVTQDVAGGGLEITLEQSTEAPTFPGDATPVLYDSAGEGRWQNAWGAIRISGTVTVGAGAAAVVGVGTRFTKYLKVGQVVDIGGEAIAILAIADDENLTLAANHVAGAAAVALHSQRADLGIWAENKDPLEIIFPGDSADHGDLDVGDTFVFQAPGTWDLPAMATLGESQRFTSAHWAVRTREAGSSAAFDERNVTGGTVGWSWAVEPQRGNGSRYPYAATRTGQFTPTIQLTRPFFDTFFARLFDALEHLDAQLAWEGQRLGSGQYREGVWADYPQLAVVGSGRPVANAGTVVETVQLRGETNDAGDDPCTVTVITPRDWTPPV